MHNDEQRRYMYADTHAFEPISFLGGGEWGGCVKEYEKKVQSMRGEARSTKERAVSTRHLAQYVSIALVTLDKTRTNLAGVGLRCESLTTKTRDEPDASTSTQFPSNLRHGFYDDESSCARNRCHQADLGHVVEPTGIGCPRCHAARAENPDNEFYFPSPLIKPHRQSYL